MCQFVVLVIPLLMKSWKENDRSYKNASMHLVLMYQTKCRFTQASSWITFTTKFANVWPKTLVYPHVGVESRASVERFATSFALVWFLWSVNDFVAAECRCLAKPFATNLANKWSSTWNLKKKIKPYEENKKRPTYTVGLLYSHRNAVHLYSTDWM